MPAEPADAVIRSARGAAAEFGAAILRIRLEGGEGRAEVVPCEPAAGLTASGSNGHSRHPVGPPRPGLTGAVSQ